MSDETTVLEGEMIIAGAEPPIPFDGPGLYSEMPNQQYQELDAVSKSRLDVICPELDGSPLHYYDKYLAPDREPEKRTEALIIGDAIHKAILEPDLLDAHFFVAPADAPKNPDSRSRNAKAASQATLNAIAYWDDLIEQNQGKTLLKPAQMTLITSMRDAVWKHPKARGLLSGALVEQSYFAIDPITGLLVKCRHDANNLDQGMALDVKSTLSASPKSFGSAIDTYRYHVQDPWYKMVPELHYGGPAIEHFGFIAIEKERPWPVEVYFLEPEDIEEGQRQMRRDLDQIARCRDANHWPSYTGGYEATACPRPNYARNRPKF